MINEFKKTGGHYILPAGFCYGIGRMAYKCDPNFQCNIPVTKETLVQSLDYHPSKSQTVDTTIGPVKIQDLLTLKKTKFSCPKETSKKITKGSVWQVPSGDGVWMCVNGGSRYDINYYLIEPGTRITVTAKKSQIFGSYVSGGEERVIAATMAVPSGNEHDVFVGVRFFGQLELVEAGEEKTYWKLVDKNKDPLKPKRFGNLGNVKSSVRVHFKHITDEDAPEWIAANDYYDEPNPRLRKFDDWKAIKYDSDNNELEVVELNEWFFMACLKLK